LQQEVVSIAYVGNIVEVWESFYENDIFITLGSDQTSLHNPWSGGYYPAGLSFEAANKMIAESPDVFVKKVKESLVRHVKAINKHTERGTYFFDYGNAFLLESSRAEADIWAKMALVLNILPMYKTF
jgi:urocanate hydratase